MTGRPGEWHLLGEDSDPLPGDSYDVKVEAKHYSDTASSIRDQVARLRKISKGGNQLVGKYAPAMQDSAGDLADHLDQSQGRFDTVATQLTTWAPTLERGRTDSMKYLKAAEAAQGTLDANKPPTTPVDKDDPDAVAKEKTRSSKHSTATTDLSTARSNYHDLMQDEVHGVRKIAGRVAKKIDDASHDKLKDSWWDSHVRKWIHDHAALLKFIADVLTWIATAIVIVCVIVGTGGTALLIAAALLGGALLLHTALAANGDGSWVDVALDAFALLTLGAGPLLSGMARTAFAMSEGMEAFAETVNAGRMAVADASGLLGKMGAWLKEGNIVVRNLRGLTSGMSKFSEVMGKAFEGGRVFDWLTMGDKEAAGLFKALQGSVEKYGPSMLRNLSGGLLNTMRPVFLSGTGVDFLSKALNPAFPDIFPGGDGDPLKPALIPDLSEWLDEHTVPHGGYW